MHPTAPWHVPVAVEDIAETGKHFDLAADAEARNGVARFAGLRDLPRLEASLDVTRSGAGGLHVAGRISATVGQDCVVTLEPVANEVDEEIDVLFMPKGTSAPQADEAKWDEPEPLIGGIVDLGVLATEFLILGLDPYPRKPGAIFEPPKEANADSGPFADLANLTKERNDR